MTLDECRVETQKHIDKVRKYIRFFTDKLTTRGENHDASKLSEEEKTILQFRMRLYDKIQDFIELQ